jgi:hypothetical protein
MMLSTFSGCSLENVGTASAGEVETTVKNVADKKISVAEAIANAQSDYDSYKEKCQKFKLRNLRVDCPSATVLSDLEELPLGNYKGITDGKELYDEFLRLLHSYIGDDLKDEYFYASKYYDHAQYDICSSWQEYLELLDGEEPVEPVALGYNEQSLEELKYVELQVPLNNVFFCKGNVYNSIPLEVKETTEFFGATQAKFLCECVATYYVNNKDDNLNDVYPLKDGIISIQDGINFMENYLNHELGIEENCSDVELKVVGVDVFKICEKYYCYRYRVVRKILGLSKIWAESPAGTGNINIHYDQNDAYMIYTNEVDQYYGNTRRLNYQKINEIDEIIPLSAALELLETKIGMNSSYSVSNVTLGYMDYDNYADEENGKFIVSWIFETRNEQDVRGTRFYINACTGEITVEY